MKRKYKGFLAGLHKKKPLFVTLESSGLVLSPAGGGKTVSFVIPALAHNDMSMLVPDLKGTLACVTGRYREKTLGHKIITLNPAGLYTDILGPSARYNPLQILIDDWEDPALRSQLFTDAGALAKQLYPDPPEQGENQYWRSGSRKFLIFAFLYLVTIGGFATLSGALCLLSETGALHSALKEAAAAYHLGGDLARLARDLLAKFDSGDPRQIESFREGAVQALEVFAPSGTLAESTSMCDFRFADMKAQKLTIYLLADPTRMKVYAPWLGVLSWCALTELIRAKGTNPACFLCDEVTNFKIEGLPAMLTLVREFKIIIWLIVQELEQWAHVYGREALETLLSQTEVKIFMNARSHRTCRLISDMLGEKSIKTSSYSFGGYFLDPISQSVQESPRKLMTPDEVRRCEDVIVFVRGLRPIRLTQIGYHEITPWKNKLAINPLFGKVFKAKTKAGV